MNDHAAVLTNFAEVRVLVRISSGPAGTNGGAFKSCMRQDLVAWPDNSTRRKEISPKRRLKKLS